MSESRSEDVSLTSEETCFCKQLPIEVIEMILKLIPRPQSVKLRVVCTTWCYILSQDQMTLCFKGTVPHDQLENCTFKKLGLKFRDVDINEVPRSMWAKIGFRVHSVVLDSCILGDRQGLKNLIIHCQNLRSLRVVLGANANNEDIFCSPSMLKELNIIQRNLDTFEISNRQRISVDVDVTKWIQIFKALFKVYPNVTRYTSGSYHAKFEDRLKGETRETREETFRFGFLKELGDDDSNGVASSLAFSLSVENHHRRQALEASFTLRLIDVSIHITENNSPTDCITLEHFFKKHKNLKCVEVNLGKWRSYVEMLTFLLKDIVLSCPNLKKLIYCENRCYWLQCENVFADICAQLPRLPGLEEVSLDGKSLRINGSSLRCRSHIHRYVMITSFLWNMILPKFIMTHCDLQHLDLEYFPCDEEILQTIFKYLINLKSLAIHVVDYSTDYEAGITGFSGLAASDGYSISRLKYLEKLIFVGLTKSIIDDGTTFDEFVFPRLHYLKVDFDVLAYLPRLRKNMPLLKRITAVPADYDLARPRTVEIEFNGKSTNFVFEPPDTIHQFNPEDLINTMNALLAKLNHHKS